MLGDPFFCSVEIALGPIAKSGACGHAMAALVAERMTEVGAPMTCVGTVLQ